MTPEQIRKRDGRVVPFNPLKIETAIARAVSSVQRTDEQLVRELTEAVCSRVEAEASLEPIVPTVELVQDAIERSLLSAGHVRIVRSYILYRARRNRIREAKSELMDAVGEILGDDPDGASVDSRPTPALKMLQVGAAASAEYYLKRFIPEEAADAHIRGDLHIHDLEHYAKTFNSFSIPLADLLTEGFATQYGSVRPAKRPGSALGLASLALQQAQNECFGGQSFSAFDRDLAQVLGPHVNETELFQAIEGFLYDLNTMHSRSGGQVPYSSVAVGLDTTSTGRLITRAVLQAFASGLGRGEPAIYPNLTFKVKRGVNLDPGDPNYDLFQVAIDVAAHRMMPNFAFLDSPFNAPCGDELTYLSGCARIPPDRHGAALDVGRANVATVSVNLPRIVLRAQRGRLDVERLLDTELQIAGRQLLHRAEVLGRLRVRDLPFLMGQGLYSGASELGSDAAIAPALRHGTYALSFVGLAESLVLLEGQHHGQSSEAQERGLALVGRMRDFVDRWSAEHDLNIVLYGAHSDAPVGRFVALDRKDFGEIPQVTDKTWYTSSFHLPADFPISCADLCALEAPYQELCNGGHLTVAEFAAAPDPRAVERALRGMLAAGLGHGAVAFPLDHCATCRVTGTFAGDCPECGAPSSGLFRVRRQAGYLGHLTACSAAKTAEIAARVPTLLEG